MYSGTAYEFCSLDSQPRLEHDQPVDAAGLMIWMGLSALADTLIIPYTTYQQFDRGSIEVKRSTR
ncbi:YceK/YidQ family lipoprotein [Pseudomonas sp. Marseille-QA0892]